MLISKNFLTREASYKPSYLTSWIQSGPFGTALPEVGRQNSIWGMAGIYAQAAGMRVWDSAVPESHNFLGGDRKAEESGIKLTRRTHRPSGTAGVGAEVIGVPGANGRDGPPTTIPAGSFSTDLGLHGPEIIIRAITAITTKAAIIGQLILFISTSPSLSQHSNPPRRAGFQATTRSGWSY